jgi:2-amino-4-hydroxy-6-hydroxymethyldihydropteridine diphosphokinase
VHQAYLNLGSNIEPEINLPESLKLLAGHGQIIKVSSAWESEAVGSPGPNFLNACVLFQTPLSHAELKEQVLRPIEAKLGRVRTADKYAPRTIDIDIVIFDDQLCNEKFWNQAFVMIPLAEIYPEYQNMITHETTAYTAARFRGQVWMEARPEVLPQFS